MNSYLDLTKHYMKVHKNRNKLTIFCILLAVSLITTIFGMADMYQRAQEMQMIQMYGNWHAIVSGIEESDAKLLKMRPEIAYAGYGLAIGTGEGYSINHKDVAINGMDEELVSLFGSGLTDGSYPEANNEVGITENAAQELGFVLGDQLKLQGNNGEELTFNITGILENSSSLLASGAAGVMMQPQAFREAFPTGSYGDRFYITFKNDTNIRKAMKDIRAEFNFSEEQLGENKRLLSIMGESSTDYMNELFFTAITLFILVLSAGVLIISSSFHTSIAERTRFFGMLRCLGASNAQVKRIVLSEGIRHSLAAIPPGVFSGVLIVWGLCGLLKYLSPGYFAQLPVFGISVPSLVMGCVIGFLTVILASLSPCKAAGRVSPLCAINGEVKSSSKHKSKKPMKLRGKRIEIMLGIQHAFSVKKNIFLMTASVAVSIILFLSFYVLVDVMHHGIRSLKPWNPDVSIISNDHTATLDEEILKQLQQDEDIKKVYGRKFAYELPMQVSGKDGIGNLISYEQYQFDWAKDSLLEGDITTIENNVYEETGPPKVMVSVSDKYQWKCGDTIVLETPLGKKEAVVQAILSSTPFDEDAGKENIICSEQTFTELIGETGYTIFDIQLTDKEDDLAVEEIRGLVNETMNFSDRRGSNAETKSLFNSFAIFVYGFLIVIALISAFGIMNTMKMSITSKIKQYGIMRATGMSSKQLFWMVFAESFTYAFWGVLVGCLLGLPLHFILYRALIISLWNVRWAAPIMPLCLIVVISLIVTFVSMIAPVKKIKNMNVVEAITAL